MTPAREGECQGLLLGWSLWAWDPKSSAFLTVRWGRGRGAACTLGWVSKSAVPPTGQLLELCIGYKGLKGVRMQIERSE